MFLWSERWPSLLTGNDEYKGNHRNRDGESGPSKPDVRHADTL